MAKFRRNYRSYSGSGVRIFLMILLIAFMVGSLVVILLNMNEWTTLFMGQRFSEPISERLYLPHCNGKLIHHENYSLCYDTTDNYPIWVGYSLSTLDTFSQVSDEQTLIIADPKLPEATAPNFCPHTKNVSMISLVSPINIPVSGGGPGETVFRSTALIVSKTFKREIWDPHLIVIHNWAVRSDITYILGGIIPTDAADSHFLFRTYLFRKGKDLCMKAFLFDFNEGANDGISEVSVDSLESLTGIGFFDDFIVDSLQTKLESDVFPECMGH